MVLIPLLISKMGDLKGPLVGRLNASKSWGAAAVTGGTTKNNNGISKRNTSVGDTITNNNKTTTIKPTTYTVIFIVRWSRIKQQRSIIISIHHYYQPRHCETIGALTSLIRTQTKSDEVPATRRLLHQDNHQLQ